MGVLLLGQAVPRHLWGSPILVLVALRLLYSCPRKSASAAAVSLHFQTSALVEKTGN
jgi:hypothetical protein